MQQAPTTPHWPPLTTPASANMELNAGFTTNREPYGVTEIIKNGHLILSTVFKAEQAMLNVLIIVGAIPR